MGEFITGWRLDPAKPRMGSMGAVEINTVQKQHVEVDICIKGAPKTLNLRDCGSISSTNRAALSAILRAP